jgi:tetratricopeptide (TPR) repeat protein
MLHKFANRRERAEVSYREAITILETLVVEEPNESLHQVNLATGYYNLGNLLCRSHRPGGVENLERARERYESLSRRRPAVSSYRADLARTLGSIAVLHRFAHRFDEARAGFERARDLLEELAHDDPTVPRHRLELITTYTNLRLLWAEVNRPENAVACLRRIRTLLEGLIQQNPEDEGLKRDLADVTAELAKANREPGRIRAVPNAFPDDVFAR